MVNEVYAYLAKGSSAESAVSHFYQEHNPFTVAQDKRQPVTQVEVHSIVQAGKGRQIVAGPLDRRTPGPGKRR